MITLYVVLGVWIKPSFFFVYAVAYPVLIFTKYRWRKEFFFSLIPILCGCLCVLYEYHTIYEPSVTIDVADEDKSGVVINILPLFTIGFWKSRLLKLGISLALPIAFFVAYWKEIKKSRELEFVFVMLVVALGISWCCRETGPRAEDGNFGWQVISSMWFVYYYMLKVIMTVGMREVSIAKSKTAPTSKKTFVPSKTIVFLALYSIHVVSGVWYLARYLITKSYF